jgi:hypothetical protein
VYNFLKLTHWCLWLIGVHNNNNNLIIIIIINAKLCTHRKSRGTVGSTHACLTTHMYLPSEVGINNYHGYSQYNWACLKTADVSGICVEGGHGSIT